MRINTEKAINEFHNDYSNRCVKPRWELRLSNTTTKLEKEVNTSAETTQDGDLLESLKTKYGSL